MNQIKVERNTIILGILLFSLLFLYNCATLSTGLTNKEEKSTSSQKSEKFDIPPSAIESFLEGEIYYMNEEYAEAVIEYQEVLNHDSSSARVYLQLAKSYLNLNKSEQGLKNLKIAKRKAPHKTEVRSLLAQVYLQNGNMDQSLQEYEYLYKNNPDNIDYGSRYAWLLSKQDKIEKAKSILTPLLKKDDPKKVNILEQLTRLNLQQGKIDSTKEYLDRLIKLRPKSEKYLSLRGKIAVGEDDYKTARYIYERLTDLKPEKKQYKQVLHDLLINREDFQKAENYFKKNMNQVNKSPDTLDYISLIRLYQKNEKYDKALSTIESGLDQFPEHSHFYYLKGLILSEIGKVQKAIENHKKAYRLAPDNTQYAHNIANLWEKNDNYEKSDSLYKKLIENNPEDAIAYNNLAYSFAKREVNLEQALQYVNEALSLQPENPSFLDTKGWILYKKGELKKAQNLIQKSLNNVENGNAEIYEHLGDIFYDLNKTEKAKKYYEKAKKLAPNNKRIQNKLTKF